MDWPPQSPNLKVGITLIENGIKGNTFGAFKEDQSVL